MRVRRRPVRACESRSRGAGMFWLAIALLATACASSSDQAASPSCDPTTSSADSAVLGAADGLDGTVAIVDVRLFDGVAVHDPTTVVFADGQIVASGPDVVVPDDAQIISGNCRTLMPGLIDAHTHTFDNGLERAVQFGVTTHLDMFTDSRFLGLEAELEASDPDRPLADLFSSSVLGTVDGGHGTQFGVPIPTLDGPDSADLWVQERVDEGASFIKLVLEDFSLFGGSAPTLDEATFVAAVEAAQANGLMTVTHVSKMENAALAINSGTDGLAHLFSDVAADDAMVALMLREEAFVIPTTVVLAAAESSLGNRTLTEDPNIGPRLTTLESRDLRRGPRFRIPLRSALESLAMLHDAGVPLLAGSDAPNPGTLYGASMHRELEFFVDDAGMAPIEALTAATSLTAKTFGLDDRGRIETGMIADLVLVSGDPTADILQTRAIVAVWKSGIPITLETPPEN